MKTLQFTRAAALLALLLSTKGLSQERVEIDIALCYPPSYAASVGGEANARVGLANSVSGVNLIQDNSGTGVRWHIAGYYQSGETANQTTTGGMVGWLANNDGRVADVVSFANAAGADLVAYVVQNISDGAAAVAQQPGRYAVYNPGQAWHAVMAHENGGHNMGAAHNDGLLNPKTIMLHNYCGGGAAPPYLYTNPNIWWNGAHLLGDGDNCGQGGRINGGDNAWRISSGAQGTADSFGRPIDRPKLDSVVLRWLFTNAPGAVPAGTTNYDIVSGLPAVVRGNGATSVGNAIRLPGGTTGNTAANTIAAYVDLPNGILSSRTNITIEVWATVRSAQNWSRIIDFGRTTQAGDGLGAPGEYTGAPGTPAPGATTASDNVFLTSSIGTDLGQQRFEARLDGDSVTVNSAIASFAGAQHHYTISFEDSTGNYGTNGGRWRWYRDGQYITHLDVNWHLSSLEDVNNWLGRSSYSGDAMANIDYAEVRISDETFTHQEVLANYLLGPNYSATAVTLKNSDASGSSSFHAAGNWSNGSAPSPTNSYETYGFNLRTPATASSYTFGGGSLKISGGSLRWKGTSSSTITVTNLTLNSGSIVNAGVGTFTLAGTLHVTNSSVVRGEDGPITLSAELKGGGPVTYLANRAVLTRASSNYTGKTFVGCGVLGNLQISSEAQLGANPAAFAADHLTLNRGWLYTTATMDIDDSNRGIRIGVSGGIFNVAPATTLTLRTPISSPFIGGGISAGLFIKENSGTLVVAGTNNSFSGPIQVNAGTLFIPTPGLPAAGVTTVADGALIMDSGVGGRIIVESGGTLSSSTNIGTISCGGLTLQAGSALTMDLGFISDLIAANGGVSLNGTLNLRASGPLVNGSYTLITYTGSRSGSGLTLGTVPPGYALSLDYTTPGEVRLVVGGGLDRSTIVSAGLAWKFNASGANLGTAWRSNSYNDTGWPSGAAQIGYGDGDEATVINTNSGKPQIVYFRKTFTLTSQEIGAMSNSILSLLRDDGAVVYLNGVEVRRDNLPAAPASIVYNTPALEAIGGTDEDVYFASSVNPSLFLAGTNLLAVEVHQVDSASSDLSFDLRLERVTEGTTQVVPFSLISTGAVWKYLADATDQGAGWRSNTFNDVSWNSGASMLGFGDANGLLPSTIVASNGQWTTYFRRTFFVPSAAQVQALNARIMRDDAAVVYLNGAEVWRDPNITAGSISYSTPATVGLGGTDESTWLNLSISTSGLVSGTNLIAIEVHQSATNSSDLAMNFDLFAGVVFANNSRVYIRAYELSWPISAGWFNVYSTTNLASPVSWSPVSGSAYQSNGTWYFPLPNPTSPQRFYRLQQR